MSFTKQEWNNGTIYRVFVKQKGVPDSNIIDVPVDIAQSELVGKVFIGVENFVLDRDLGGAGGLADFHNQDQDLIDYWATVRYICMRSINLAPDIDYSTKEQTDTGTNSRVFARLPLETVYLPKEGQLHPMIPRVTGSFSLNKDGILCEMTNNPNALSNGRMRIELLDEDGDPLRNLNDVGGTFEYPIDHFSFTLVIYKPRNTYN